MPNTLLLGAVRSLWPALALLVTLFTDVEGVSAVVQHDCCQGVYHDFYVQGMSAIVPLGFELEDLTGEAYITKPKTIKGFRKRIGLRWQGQMAFEAEHQKKFPYDLMFDALKDVLMLSLSPYSAMKEQRLARLGLSRFH
jgi:hypothetical protein